MNFNNNSNNSNGGELKQNKGFTIYLGDTYVAFLTIAEFDRNGRRLMAEEDAIALQEAVTMESVLATAEMRPYAPKEVKSSPALSAVIAKAKETKPAPVTEAVSPLQ